MNIATASPVEIDTEIQRLEIELSLVTNQLRDARDIVRRAIGQEVTRERTGYAQGRSQYRETWPTSWTEAEKIARELDPTTESADWRLVAYSGVKTVGAALATLDALVTQVFELNASLAPLYARYNAERWTRVYLVTNSNGHVHSHTSCRNCYVTTTYYWVTELSGSTDAEVVAQAGGQSCLTCYDSVREQIDANRECRIEEPAKRQAREDREAAAKARADKKAIKGITTPDGQPLVIRKGNYPETIKTQRAAEIELVDLLFWAGRYGQADTTQAVRQQILEALAAKKGTSVEEELAAAQKRLAARNKREGRY